MPARIEIIAFAIDETMGHARKDLDVLARSQRIMDDDIIGSHVRKATLDTPQRGGDVRHACRSVINSGLVTKDRIKGCQHIAVIGLLGKTEARSTA